MTMSASQTDTILISTNYTDICRLCLCKNKPLTSLYANSERKKSLPELISICVDLKISQLDGLPDQICKICSGKLNSSYDFRVQCQKSNETLTKLSTAKISKNNDTHKSAKDEKLRFKQCTTRRRSRKLHYTSDDEIPLAIVANKKLNIENSQITEMIHNDGTFDQILSLHNNDSISMNDSQIQIKVECDPDSRQLNKMKMESQDTDQEDLLLWGSNLNDDDREYIDDGINDSQYDMDCISIKKEKKDLSQNDSVKLKKKKKKIPKKLQLPDKTGESKKYNMVIDKGQFICNICCETSSTKDELKKHKTFHYSYTCKNCKTSFKNIADIRLHSCKNKPNDTSKPQTHSEDCASTEQTDSNKSLYIRMLICHICERQFKYSRTLQYHIRSHTGEKPALCTWCGKDFREPRGLLNHVRAVHTGEKRFKCSFCPKAFPVSGKRRQHERVHTGERPYQCDLCLRMFTARTTLTAHRRRHTGENKFRCSVQGCSQGFYAFSTFQRHMWAHRGERPYTCTHCGKSYLSNQNLRSHIKAAHTKLRDEVCHVCGKGFTEKSVLNRHLRKIHNFEPKDSKPAPIYGTPAVVSVANDVSVTADDESPKIANA